MHNEPTPPEEPPVISQRRLWTALLGPTAATLLFSLPAMLGSGDIEGSILLSPLGALITIVICQVLFLRTMKVRYRGRSMALLGFGFFIGQLVICFAVWFGACVLVVA